MTHGFAYFSSFLSRFASLAAATASRALATFFAVLLYAVVRTKGPFPSPTGARYTAAWAA